MTEIQRLSDEALNQIKQVAIETAVDMTLNALKHERDMKLKRKQDYRMFNVKLLISNYHLIKSRCESIPEEIEELNDAAKALEEGVFFDDRMFSEKKVTIEYLTDGHLKSYRLMQYINRALEAYEKYAKSKGFVGEREYKILFYSYISDSHVSTENLAERFGIATQRVYQIRHKALKELSVFLFGAEALEFR